MEYKALCTGHGQLDKLFAKVMETFIENIDHFAWIRHVEPTIETLGDKFRPMIRDGREVDRENASASGIAENVNETDQLLDDLIHEMDTEEQMRKEKKKKQMQRRPHLY